jgi:hypothetical protein
MIPSLPFGRTGHISTRVLFGAAALSRVTQAEADRAVETTPSPQAGSSCWLAT